MREAKGLRNRYNDLGKNITLREDAIKEMIEIMRQYQDRNRDLQTQLDWSRPVKAKLQEPIPTIKDVATLQLLIDEHRVSLGSSFKFERNTLWLYFLVWLLKFLSCDHFDMYDSRLVRNQTRS